MGRWRVYLKPFNDSGVYESSWTDISDDVLFDSMGSVAVDLDNTEFDIGVYRNSSFSLSLINDHGKYSDISFPKSVFKYSRGNTLVRITWDYANDYPICGTGQIGTMQMSNERTILEGLLSDESLEMEIDDQKAKFKVLGREFLFQQTVVPFDTVDNGDLFSVTLYKILNQTGITDYLTVSQANITCGSDQTIDSIASLQNKTVQEGLNKLLLMSNSVLYIKDDTVYVAPRTPTAAVQYTFYGQASESGAEDIIGIKKIRNGMAKTFNYFTWKDAATLSAEDSTSTAKYGVRKREISADFTTDTTKRQNILNALRDEFGMPKQEFDLYTPLDEDTVALELLDRVTIDYPAVFLSENAPVCGAYTCGENPVLPKALFSFVLDTTEYYKIIGRSIDIKSQVVKFKMRAV